MPKKLMWFSNAPWEPSGYGQQTSIMTSRLRDRLGYDVGITAFHGLQGSILPWTDREDGVPILVYPKWVHPWGSDIMTPHARHFGARIVVSLFDIWVADTSMIGQSIHEVAWCPWIPIDSEPLPPQVRKAAEFATERIAFSRFGESIMRDAGLDCYYVPHGIDKNTFYRTDQFEARERLGIPEDVFVFSVVAANHGAPSRKCFTEQMIAFKMFKENVDPNAVLVLHTTNGEGGEWGGEKLISFAHQIGLAANHDVLFPRGHDMTLGFSPAHLNDIYNATDVLLHVSRGEGFGLTGLEAQMAGTPVITGAWTAMDELCFGGFKVPKSEAIPHWNPLESWHYTPPPQAILKQMKDAYEELSPRYPRANARIEEYSLMAREGAEQYDADLVVDEYWKPVLEDIFARVEGEDDDFADAIQLLSSTTERGADDSAKSADDD